MLVAYRRNVEKLELDIGGLRFSALAAGDADAELVLLLHGFPQTARAFGRQLEQLAGAGYHAVAPELRGIVPGARPNGTAHYTLDLASTDTLEIAGALAAESFHLVGHDLGGIIAWQLGCRDPERVRSLTIASTPHLVPFGRAILDGTAERLPPFALFRQPDVPEQMLLADDAALLRAAYAGIDADATEDYTRTFSQPEVLSAMLGYFRAFDFEDWLTLPPTAIATTFVYGMDDPFLTPAVAAETRSHVSGVYEEVALDGIGHWVPELAPDRMSELILERIAS